jgi:hypothetical protein
MAAEEISIEVYNTKERITTNLSVAKLALNEFRMIENDIFNHNLTRGTEFETFINADGNHEILTILTKSPFITRRFLLTSQFTESEYRLLGDEITEQGGFWQVDFGGFVTINLPKESKLNLDEIFKMFDCNPAEITD